MFKLWVIFDLKNVVTDFRVLGFWTCISRKIHSSHKELFTPGPERCGAKPSRAQVTLRSPPIPRDPLSEYIDQPRTLGQGAKKHSRLCIYFKK